MAAERTSAGERAPMGDERLEDVVALLDVEELEVNIFRGASPDEDRPRVFGGQVAAQALMSAMRTVDADRPPHSLHAYFLRPGDVKVPILYLVDRIRDGRSFTTRRVVAVQHGEAIFNLAASFHAPEPGVEHQTEMPKVSGPEDLMSLPERLKGFGRKFHPRALRRRAIDIRYCDPPDWKPHVGADGAPKVWMKADGELPDDPRLHVCMMVYASDYTLTETVMRTHGIHWSDRGTMAASLDHSMWFHHPMRADRWWLYVEDSPAAAGARGLARGSIYDSDGRLACSVAQEILLRIPRPDGNRD